jgi:hypothetical protein
LDWLRRNREMTIVLIAHSAVETVKRAFLHVLPTTLAQARPGPGSGLGRRHRLP